MKQKAGLSWTFVVALMLSSAACTGSADSSEPTPASSTSTPTLLEQVVADYNVRNNAAIAAAGHYDASLWKTADAGAILDGDMFDTRYDEVFNEPAQTGEHLYRAAQQYGTVRDSYPKWVLGTVTTTNASAAPTPSTATASSSTAPSSDPDTLVAVFEQASDGAPWLMSQEVATRRADLPTEASGAAATLEQQQNATVIGQLLAKWFSTGEALPWLDLRQAADFRAKQVDPGEFSDRRISCSLYSDLAPQTGVSDAIRVARAGSTSLIAVSLRCSTTTTAAKSRTVVWKEGWDKLYPNEPGGAYLRKPWVAMVLLASPDDGTPAVLGIRGDTVL